MRYIGYYTIRLNSKRIPQKNTKKLGGRYLLNYSLETLNSLPFLDDIVLYSSSDLSRYIEPGLRYTWIQRGVEHDSDDATFNSILDSVIDGLDGDYIVFLLSTSPFIQAETITDMVAHIESGDYDSAVAVVKHRKFAWYKGQPVNHTIDQLERTQNLEPIYIEGGVFIFSKKLYQETRRRIGYRPYFRELSIKEGWDIDYMEEWEIAEWMS